MFYVLIILDENYSAFNYQWGSDHSANSLRGDGGDAIYVNFVSIGRQF